MNHKIRVGITQGDINGIGYEVTLKAFRPEEMRDLCTPVLFGSGKIVGYYRKALGLNDFNYNQISRADDARDGEFNVVNVTAPDFSVQPGVCSHEAGNEALAALEAAVQALRNGDIDVLVTAPINKEGIHSEAFPFSGHTEYLAARFADTDEEEDEGEADEEKEEGETPEDSESKEGTDAKEEKETIEAAETGNTPAPAETKGKEPLMILFNENMRIALATTHLPIAEVAAAITTELIERKLRLFSDSLKRDFGIECPRIAVLSLNPHAGDGGLLGKEENEVISPAIARMRTAGILAFGPYAADGFFGHDNYRKFDGVLAMYHDQGLAPFKGIGTDPGVNFTAGLRYVRTSPDHGTGYDIAGRGEAYESSMRHAVYAAIDIHRNRLRHDRAAANPLRKQYVARGKDKTIDLSKEE